MEKKKRKGKRKREERERGKKERRKIEKGKRKVKWGKEKRRGRREVSAHRRRWRGARARGGMRGWVREPGEAVARAAGANRGRQSRVGDRPPSGTEWDDGEEKESGTTNGVGCWESGVRDREKIPRIKVQGFRRILSSTMKIIFFKKIYF